MDGLFGILSNDPSFYLLHEQQDKWIKNIYIIYLFTEVIVYDNIALERMWGKYLN